MPWLKLRLLCIGIIGVVTLGFAEGFGYQYEPVSAFIKNPDLTVPYVARCADFWKKSCDRKFGGFFTMVKRDGSPDKSDDVKTVLTQSRHAYGFARAYMMTGNREYLTYARHALDFLYRRCRDRTNGGFHTTLDRRGTLLDGKEKYPLSGEKWSFMQHYALLGIAAMYDATRSAKDYDILAKERGVIDVMLWDERPGYDGYYETADYNWSNPRDKGFTPTVDGITTHGESMYLLANDEKYRRRLIELADIVVKRIYPTLKTRRLGFAEKYSSDWRAKPDSLLFIGHVLKTAWCLDRAYLVEPKPEYKRISEELLTSIRAKAWDEKYGGPFYLGDSISGNVTSHEKNWWTLEQAINAGLLNYYLTGNVEYLEMADKSADFFEDHLIDREYGEVFASVDADGSTPTSQMKGDYWKAGYHSIETGYYIYLYGNLLVHKKPASLFYMIDKVDSARSIPLNPIATGNRQLVIKQVTLDGKPYQKFKAKGRILSVPAGTGGEFRVTFGLSHE